MQLFILTNADGSPVADKSEAAVTSMSDLTPLADAGELVLGDNEAIELKFTTATGSAPAFAGGATYAPAITLGTLTTDGSGNYAGATDFASITAGWSARIAMTSTALISAINILGSGYGNPRGGWLTLQVQVTDPSGYVQTYAMLKVFVEWRVLASTSLEPLTPIEEVLANAANVTALKAALGLTGTSTTLFLTSTAEATDSSGSTGTFGTQGGISVKKSVRIGGVLVAGTDATALTDSAGKILSAALNTVAVANGGTGGTTSTGSGAVVLANTPTLITPVIGTATGTSLFLSSTTDATNASGTSGSLGTQGGMSVAKRLYVGSTASFTAMISGPSCWFDTQTLGRPFAIGGAIGSTTYKNNTDSVGKIGGNSDPNIFEISALGASGTIHLVTNSQAIKILANAATPILQIGGGALFGTISNGNFAIVDTTDADGVVGSLTTSGGVSITKKLFVGTDLRVNGLSGFNNTSPIAKPTVTGSRGSNAALASLLTALANYGLVTDSTS